MYHRHHHHQQTDYACVKSKDCNDNAQNDEKDATHTHAKINQISSDR